MKTLMTMAAATVLAASVSACGTSPGERALN